MRSFRTRAFAACFIAMVLARESPSRPNFPPPALVFLPNFRSSSAAALDAKRSASDLPARYVVRFTVWRGICVERWNPWGSVGSPGFDCLRSVDRGWRLLAGRAGSGMARGSRFLVDICFATGTSSLHTWSCPQKEKTAQIRFTDCFALVNLIPPDRTLLPPLFAPQVAT